MRSNQPADRLRAPRAAGCGTLVISTRLSLANGGGGSGRWTGTTSLGGGYARAADEVRVQVAREIPDGILQHLVAAEQPVVAPNRGDRDEEAEGGHDERAADRARDLVDARLAGEADRDERVHDAPDRAEETDERSRGAHGGEEAQALAHVAVDLVDRALQRHGDPLVHVDAVGEAALMVRHGAQPVLGNGTEAIALLQALYSVLDGRCRPKLLLRCARGLLDSALIPQLRQDD